MSRIVSGAIVLPSPTLTFAFLLATLMGSVFHLIIGGSGRRFALYLLAGWVGFAVGHLIGIILEINLFNIGTLRAASAAFGALIALFAARFLTGTPPRTESRRVQR